MALNPITYVRESYAELQKVVWPTKLDTIKLTLIVLGVSVLVGAYVAGLDAVFTKITEIIFVK